MDRKRKQKGRGSKALKCFDGQRGRYTDGWLGWKERQIMDGQIDGIEKRDS